MHVGPCLSGVNSVQLISLSVKLMVILLMQVSSLQDEVKSLSDRLGSVTVEKNHLEKQLEEASRQLTLAKSRSRDLMAAGITEAKVTNLFYTTQQGLNATLINIA